MEGKKTPPGEVRSTPGENSPVSAVSPKWGMVALQLGGLSCCPQVDAAVLQAQQLFLVVSFEGPVNARLPPGVQIHAGNAMKGKGSSHTSVACCNPCSRAGVLAHSACTLSSFSSGSSLHPASGLCPRTPHDWTPWNSASSSSAFKIQGGWIDFHAVCGCSLATAIQCLHGLYPVPSSMPFCGWPTAELFQQQVQEPTSHPLLALVGSLWDSLLLLLLIMLWVEGESAGHTKGLSWGWRSSTLKWLGN
uniref:Uncharacterized protein n=1 Tax=Molossus molossus TaxID=27622 RepID=A0A7J8DTQ8_MOLMO|nr:hypothetical protein HJG59_009170 [Molossus molossus]